MVMVLLFLGVIFGLLGWQALSSSGKSPDDSASPASSLSASPAPTSKAGANQVEVRIYNISSKEGVAARTKDQLTAAGFKIADVGNLSLSEVSTTTVYYTDAEGEHDTADAVGKDLGAAVEPRIPALGNQPPGVIVLVAG